MRDQSKQPSKTYEELNQLLRDGVDQLRLRAADSALVRAELNGETNLQFSLSSGLRRKKGKGRIR